MLSMLRESREVTVAVAKSKRRAEGGHREVKVRGHVSLRPTGFGAEG